MEVKTGINARFIHAFALACADAAAILAAAFLSFAASALLSKWMLDHTYAPVLGDGTAFMAHALLAVSLTALAWFHSRRHYTGRIEFWWEMRDVVCLAMFAVVAEGFFQFIAKVHVSRLWVVQTWIMFVPLAAIARLAVKAIMVHTGLRTRRVLLVGAPDSTALVEAALVSDKLLGYVIAARALLDSSALERAVSESAADLVVVASGEASDGKESEILRELTRLHIPYAVCPPLSGICLAAMRPQLFFSHDVLLLFEEETLARPLPRFAKRAFDLVAASALLIVLLPILVAVAWLVRRDGGPALFGHERIGMHGRRFRCLKFRSMAPDAELRLSGILKADPNARAEWERDRKLRNDPRVTPIGKILRQWAVDELPQLLNVLRGEMSLVGPRPVVAAELERYGIHRDAYLMVRPGITGLWQASGRSDVSYDRRVALDAWYVRNWSPWIDIAVMAKTVPALLMRRGAY